MTGTLAGMTVWGIVYASLGGASRSLLKSGMDLEELIAGWSYFISSLECHTSAACVFHCCKVMQKGKSLV